MDHTRLNAEGADMKTDCFISGKIFKIMMVVLMFLPLVTQKPYDSRYTVNVIAEVLKNPYSVRIKVFLPAAKAALLAAAVSPLLFAKSEKIILGYYAVILMVVSVFQNMSDTQYGFTFIPGNMILQLIIAAIVLIDLHGRKSRIEKNDMDARYLWVIPFMALAFLMPYGVKEGIIVPSVRTVLINDAGVAYCMITPVILGTLMLFHKYVHRETMHAIAFLGFSFGILNMMTWFGYQRQNWWMGICHLPLLILSFSAMRMSKGKKAS